MNVGMQDKKKLTIFSVLGIVALGCVYYAYTQLFPADAPPVVAPVAVATTQTPSAVPLRKSAGGNTAGVSKVAGVNTSAQLDPTLHMEAMLVTESLVYSGNGRNIFSVNSAPAVVIPKTIARVRMIEPIAPVRTGPVGPPPPPPIELKFFGTETNATGSRRAFLLHGEDVFLVGAGDIVQRRYRVISIDARSILIEDIPNSNRQTLPLLSN
jgi:hypothetical protein